MIRADLNELKGSRCGSSKTKDSFLSDNARNVGQRQITGESTQFLPLADWAGMVETELFAQTNRSYVLQITKPTALRISCSSRIAVLEHDAVEEAAVRDH